MPELPEVECVRRMLEPLVLGARIESVSVLRRDVVTTPDDPPGGWSRSGADAAAARPVGPEELLAGQRVTGVERHGKALALIADSGRCLVIHLGMTGWVGPCQDPPAAHTHLVWQLEGGHALAFTDPRRFGGVWCLPDLGSLRERWGRLGPDALSVRAAELRAATARRTTPVKAALLNQQVIAGVGNIYADEALFSAGLHPRRLCTSIPPPDWAKLARAVRTELERGIRWGGATVRSYRRPDGSTGERQRTLRVYGRGGHECVVCGTGLESGLVAQRTTVWCPSCQPFHDTTQ